MWRWVVRTESGRSAFVKAALGSDAAPWLHSEARVYREVSARWLPELFGYRAGGDDVASVLVIEDLSRARWGVPLDVHDAELLRDALHALTEVKALTGLPGVELQRQWGEFAEDPWAVTASGLVDETWLSRCLPDLVAAESAVEVAGDGLVHRDLFLQNWCRAARGAVIVDWARPWRGNGDLCVAWGEAGVRAAGGPGGVVLPPGCASWAAYVAGQIVWVPHRPRRAGASPPCRERAARGVRVAVLGGRRARTRQATVCPWIPASRPLAALVPRRWSTLLDDRVNDRAPWCER